MARLGPSQLLKPHIRASGGRSSLELVSRLSQSAQSRLIRSFSPAPHQVFPLVYSLPLRRPSLRTQLTGSIQILRESLSRHERCLSLDPLLQLLPLPLLLLLSPEDFKGDLPQMHANHTENAPKHLKRPLRICQKALVVAPLSVFPSAPRLSETELGLPQTASAKRALVSALGSNSCSGARAK